MAQVAASAIVAGVPGVGWLGGLAIMGAAGFIDNRFLYPHLLGSKGQARPPRLLELPTSTASPGAPRVWTIGRRIRVPTHAIYTSEKVREETAGGSKGGQAGTIRRVFMDAGLRLNDRLTQRLVQLRGNGQLIYSTDRNLYNVSSSNMTAADSSGSLLLTMASTADPDFAGTFEVDDVAELRGWVSNGGPDINAGYWKVTDVTPHTSAPSTLTLAPYGGQSLASLAATAGTVSDPASAHRVDDALVDDTAAVTGYTFAGFTSRLLVEYSDPLDDRVRELFQQSDEVLLQGFIVTGGPTTTDALDGKWRIVQAARLDSTTVQLSIESTFNTGDQSSGTITAGTSDNAGFVRNYDARVYPRGLFASDPGDSFYQGTEDQAEDSILARRETTGTIPGFRGQSYVTLDQFDLSTYFGNQLPILEALIDPDPQMNWQQAIVAVCERHGLDQSEVDVSGVTARPFLGYYLRGATTGISALQPLLIAGQIVDQERDGVLAFFDIDNADVVQIENGADFSDLGATSGSDTPNTGDKIVHGQVDDGDLPTSVGVKHQDPDNVYADGYQAFALRNPSADRVNEQELDLSTMVLTRKEAANIAATSLRRTWINANTVEVSLPVAYLEVCENDLITVTDDDGNDILARVIRIDIGTNWIADVLAVREQLAAAVTGSPVQGSGNPVSQVTQVSEPLAQVLDVPPLWDESGREPGYYVAACAPPGGNWGGCIVYESKDGGTTYRQVATLTQQSGIGSLTADLDPASSLGESVGSGPTFDTSVELNVEFQNIGQFTPASASDDDVSDRGWNWMLVDDVENGTWEILGARDVTVETDGTYTFSRLLRGLRGTYASAADTKVAGSRVTMLFQAQASMAFVPLNNTALPLAIKLKFVPVGGTLAETDAVDVTVEGWNARPMPVRDYDFDRDAGTETRTWTFRHWSRVNHPVGFQGPFALDEAFEGYRVRIYDPTGATLMRVKRIDANGSGSSSLPVPEVPYTSAEQTTDGYTPGASETFVVEIEQMGDFGTDGDDGGRLGGRFVRVNE